MNILSRSTKVITTCLVTIGLVIGTTQQARADYQSFTLAPGFHPDPATGSGHSGGPRLTEDCGYVDTANDPDHTVTLTRSFTYLRAYVSAPGDVTLLIEGPMGRICSDDVNGRMPEFGGRWQAGTYRLWVGDFSNSNYRYQLFLSER